MGFLEFETVQNRFPNHAEPISGWTSVRKTYEHVYTRPYGDFQIFGLQLGLDHRLGYVQSWLRWNPSLTPFGYLNCCKPDKNRFFFISHSTQTIKNGKAGFEDCFWSILSNLEKVVFFFAEVDRKWKVPIFTVFSRIFRGKSDMLR